jgi:hypothetical protein
LSLLLRFRIEEFPCLTPFYELTNVKSGQFTSSQPN